jgi:DNA invertase Pin-like site-specific DNA recombinase
VTRKKPAGRRPADDRRPIAVSYVRFSDPSQRRGDSLRRQTADTEAWCQKNGVPLDRGLSCLDAGRSAYHGRHRDDKAALGRFLELVREGRVPHGSYLVIENLDRLSREDERTALRLWLDILDSGISIVQLHPETVFRHDRSDMIDIMRAILELSRGHSESRMKSVRSLANWAEALRLAREEGRPVTGRLPGWVELGEAGLALVPERAVVVARVFQLAREGYGFASIARKLNAGGVPAFGDRVEDENGGHRKAGEGRYGCGQWRAGYVRSILSDRRAVGEYQPCDAEGRKKGEPIEGYYPRVVSDEEFYAARHAAQGRRVAGANRQGRIGGVPNLFSGLLRHARDGGTYYAATRSDRYGVSKVLLNKSSLDGQGRAYTFDYATFERAVLTCLREIDPREVTGAAPPVTEVSVLRGELNELRARKAELVLALDGRQLAAVVEKIASIEAREGELAREIEESTEVALVPRADRWRDLHTLIGVLDGASEAEREDVRLRLRAAVRRNVDAVWVLVVPRGRDRLLAAQIYFAEGRGRRDYLVYFKAGWANGRGSRVEGDWRARSLAEAAVPADLDLRHAGHAGRLARLLEGIDLAALWQAMGADA